MGTILQTSDYPAIRSKLGITTDDLADSDIDSIALLPVTEALVERAIPTYATILVAGGPDKVFLQASTLALCAALAVDALEMKRSQAFKKGDYSESETKADWGKLRCDLMAESQSYMLLVSAVGGALQVRTVFVAAGPTSAGTTWPLYIEQWFRRVTPLITGWLADGGQRFYGWENMP